MDKPHVAIALSELPETRAKATKSETELTENDAFVLFLSHPFNDHHVPALKQKV